MKTSSKKLTQAQVKDIVWSIYESYKYDSHPFKTWGWCDDEEVREENRKLNIQEVLKMGSFNDLIVSTTFDDIYSLHEHRSGDEQETSEEIDNISKLLWMSQGKIPTEKGRDRLLEILEEMEVGGTRPFSGNCIRSFRGMKSLSCSSKKI